MNINAYIQKLNNLNLTIEELLQTGSSEELAEEDSRRFALPIKTESFNENEPILSIAENCNLQYFNIFFFTFSEINDIGPYIIFGNREADYLGIHKDTDEVYWILYTNVIEYEMGELEEDEIVNIIPASAGQQEFLEALYYAAKLTRKLMKQEATLNDKNVVEEYIESCTKAAGGEKYREFWDIFINQ